MERFENSLISVRSLKSVVNKKLGGSQCYVSNVSSTKINAALGYMN